VLVSGRVSPVLAPGETVAVSYRVNGGGWRLTQAREATGGGFRLHLTDVRTGAVVLAQAVGTSTVAGAGTSVARFTVTR
jgi:hypothetical protein